MAEEPAEREKLSKLTNAIGGDVADAKRAVAAAQSIKLPPAEIVRAMLPLGLRNDPQRINEEAVEVIVRLKADAVPELAAALKSGPLEHRLIAILSLGRIGIPSRKASTDLALLLKDDNPLVRMNAIECLQQIGARTAMRSLRERLDVEDENRIVFTLVTALIALGAPTDDIVPLLTQWMNSGNPFQKLIAAKSLAQLGPEAAPAVDPLIAFFSDSDVDAGRMAAETLGRIGPAAKSAVPAILKAIENEKYGPHRAELAEWLWRLSRDPAAPATVKKVLQDEPTVGHAMLLWRMDQSPEAIDAVRSLLKSEQRSVRIDALRFVIRIGPAAASAAPEVVTLLKDDDVDVRLWAAMALGRLGRVRAEATDALKDSTRSEDAMLRTLAGWSLWITTGETKPVVASLSDEDPEIRKLIAERLGPALVDNPMIRTALRTALKDVNPFVRIRCAEALWRSSQDRAVFPIILQALKNSDPEVRQAAALTIGYTFPAGDALLIDELVALLEDEVADVRATACEALGRIGKPAAMATALFLRNLKAADEDDAIVSASAEALGLLGDSSPEIVESLRHSLKHLNPYVRVHAALALQNLTQDDSIKSVLEEGLKSRDCRARIVAAEALGKRKDPRAVPALLEVLVDSRFSERELASNERFMVVRALSRLGAAAKPAISALKEMQHDEDVILQGAVAAALVQVESAPE